MLSVQSLDLVVLKAKLQAIAKVVDPVATVDDPVVEVVHEKRRGRQT
jgi:hypothetical protein